MYKLVPYISVLYAPATVGTRLSRIWTFDDISSAPFENIIIVRLLTYKHVHLASFLIVQTSPSGLCYKISLET